jgi:hypothetical protein
MVKVPPVISSTVNEPSFAFWPNSPMVLLNIGQTHLIGVAQDRHDQPAWRGYRDTNVIIAVINDVAAVNRTVDRRIPLERFDHRLDEKAHEAQPHPMLLLELILVAITRNSITGFILISLNVVNIAVLFFAISNRSATRARNRVIGTRCSSRPSASGARLRAQLS